MSYNSTSPCINLNRRHFLHNLSYVAAAMVFPNLATATIKKNHSAKHLTFENLHTGETLSATYFENGRYVNGALKELNHILRDHRSGDVFSMDPSLFDLLHEMQYQLGVKQPIQIISGYRSPATNAQLQKETFGVATKSLHMLGKAIDIRMEGVNSNVIKQTAIAMQRGGVGYYPDSDFVHVDTGRVRHW